MIDCQVDRGKSFVPDDLVSEGNAFVATVSELNGQNIVADVTMTSRPVHTTTLRATTKRVLDIVLASAMIVAFLPLMILIGLMVWRADGGPVIFGHRRIGQDGRSFKCLKFRTMVRDAQTVLDEALALNSALRREWEESYKLENDPRILGEFGSFLRRSSLDELPQLFNVLRGDMSLVGPRPIIYNEISKYGAYKRHYMSVKPGLTGPWQIGGRSHTTYEERVEMDVWYVENASLKTDISILIKTLSSFVRGQLGGAK